MKNVRLGQLFNLSVIALGEFDLPITERVDFTMNSDVPYSTQIDSMPYNYQNVKCCRNLGFRSLSEREFEYLSLYPLGYIDTFNAVFVVINLIECPSGFVHTKVACTCDKILLEITGHEDLCNIDTGLI